MKKSQYDVQYAKDHLKRVPLDLTLDDYDILQKVADASGESVNAYIKHAIALRMAKDYDNQNGSAWKTELRNREGITPSKKQTIVNMFFQIMEDPSNT